MKQTDSINRNKHEKQIQLIAINVQLIAINMKQTDSINRNKQKTDRFN